MRKRLLFIVVSMLFFINSCASSEKPLITPDKEILKGLQTDCEAQGKVFVYNEKAKESSCKTPLPDTGKRCTATADCQGYCEGSNASVSSGNCSVQLQPSGCLFIVERGERFWRCFNNA